MTSASSSDFIRGGLKVEASKPLCIRDEEVRCFVLFFVYALWMRRCVVSLLFFLFLFFVLFLSLFSFSFFSLLGFMCREVSAD